MILPMTFNKIFLVGALTCGAAVAPSSPWFASRVVGFHNLGSGVYGDPSAVLGSPTTWIRDTSPNGGPDQHVAPSLGYGTWNVGAAGEPLLATIRSGGFITVEFSPPIQDAHQNWFGYDFIVFGNTFLACTQTLGWNTNLNLVNVLSGPDWVEPMAVSVSPDGIRWYTYPNSVTSGADGLWPTQAFTWDATNEYWGAPSTWTKPVPPTLTRFSVTGQTLANAVQMYQGSGGGTAFDLGPSGFRSIRYIRVDGNGGEVDAFARVSRAHDQALPIVGH